MDGFYAIEIDYGIFGDAEKMRERLQATLDFLERGGDHLFSLAISKKHRGVVYIPFEAQYF